MGKASEILKIINEVTITYDYATGNLKHQVIDLLGHIRGYITGVNPSKQAMGAEETAGEIKGSDYPLILKKLDNDLDDYYDLVTELGQMMIDQASVPEINQVLMDNDLPTIDDDGVFY